MNTTTEQHRCEGLLLGLAAGDRNGGPIRMAVRLAESLLELGRFDADDIVGRYLKWWKEGAFDTGPVSDLALQFMVEGFSPSEAVSKVHYQCAGQTAGCNPAHRSSPLAMLAPLSDDELPSCAVTEAHCTHFDPLAGDVAAAVNVLCRALIRRASWESALLRMTSDRMRPTKEAVLAAQEGPGTTGGFAPEVLRAAVHFVGSSSNFTEALERSLSFAGSANYSPVLVGAIGGARWGRSAIDPQSLTDPEIRQRVEAAADGLAEGW